MPGGHLTGRVMRAAVGRRPRGIGALAAVIAAAILATSIASPALAATPGSLSGTVTDAVTHAPVANVCVTAYDVNNPFAIGGQTDTLGHYTLSSLPPGTYKVGFQACLGGNYQAQYYNNKASQAAADPVTVAEGTTTSGIDAALQPGGQITGTVTNAVTGAPISGVCVGATGPNNSPGGFANTDTAGHYTISGLAAGTYTIAFTSCTGGNYLPQYYNNRSSAANADPVMVSAAATTSGIDAALQPGGQITGTVTNAATGAPIAGACVSAAGSNNTPGGFASTDASGHYTINGLASGSYTVGFQGCGGGNYVAQFYNNKPSPGTADPVTVTAGNTTSGIDAALQLGGQITGSVTNAATGEPLSGACVGATSGPSGPGVFVSTDPAGHYTIPGLAAGTYTISFRSCASGNYLPQYYNDKSSSADADPVTVIAGNTTSGIDAALQPGGQITGTVTNAATGDPLSGVCVTAIGADNNPAAFASTDASGHYTINGLDSGSYTVSFSPCGGGDYLPQYFNGRSSQADADPVAVTAGTTTSGIDAALEPAGRISGTVTDATTGEPVANVCVVAITASNAYASYATTDTSGNYTLPGLASGSYTVGFQLCGGGNYAPQYYNNKPSAATADPVQVTAGATVSGIDAALHPGGQITGTVMDAVTHHPISGACVGIYDSTDQFLTYTQTDSAGAYTISGLATGSYKVGFASGGSVCPIGPGDYRPVFYNDQPSSATADLVSVTEGTPTSGIDAALQPAGDSPPDTPSAPTSNQAMNNDGGQTLSWTAVSDPDGDQVDHYVVQHERSDQTTFSDVATVSGTSYRFGADGPSEGEGTWTYRVIAVDSRGTSSAPSDPSAPVVVDTSPPNPPTSHADPSAAYVDSATGVHWYKDKVTIRFDANGDPLLSDGSPGSGVAAVTPAKTYDASNVDPATGAFSQDGSAADHAGNVSAPTTVAGSVDWATPTATFSGCPRFHVLLHSAHTVAWKLSDPIPSSGLAGAADGSMALDTGRVGVHTVHSPVPADHVGHIGNPAGCTYTVDYAFSGFASPVDNPPDVNDVRSGSTVPLKWQLTDAHHRYVSALSAVTSITYKPTDCGSFTSDPAGGAPATPAGGTGLRYDPASHQYVFNWRTPAPGCYSLFLTLDSGQVEPAYFRVARGKGAHLRM